MRAVMASGDLLISVAENLKSQDDLIRGPSSWLLRKLTGYGPLRGDLYNPRAHASQIICVP